VLSLQVGRPPNGRTIHIQPAWLLVPAGLALCLLIGLMQGYSQSPRMALLLLGAGLAVAWTLTVAIKPEWAIIFYTVMVVNLNGIDLPIPIGGVRVSPDIVLTSLLVVGTAARIMVTQRTVGILPITAPYLVFLAVPVITLLWSPVKIESVRGIFRFVGYYALIWLIVDVIKTQRQVRHMVWALMLSAILPILIAFYQALTGSGQTIWAGTLLNRVYGLAGGPFTLAFYLVLIIPLILVFFLSERRSAARGTNDGVQQGISDGRLKRLALLVLLLGAGAVLILTFIRGSWIALLVALILLGVLEGSLRFRQLILSIPLVVAGVLVAFSPVLDRMAQVADPNSTWFGRVLVWRFAAEWILDSPLNLLVGLGMKAFEYHYILLAGPLSAGLYWRRERFLLGNRPHNELIGFLLDVGLIGTLAMIVVLYIVVRIGYRVFKKAPDRFLQLVGLAFLASTTGMLVGALGDNVFSQPTVAVYFWIMAALVMAIDRHLMGQPAEDPSAQVVVGKA
jgi:O-antigen ligase